MYEATNALPYPIVAISGRFYSIRIDTDNSVNDITGTLVFPPSQPLYHFAQGEQFLVVQAGDYTTLPAFWDGASMRQSGGLTATPKELPAAGPMVYYQGRMWYAYYRQYTAGDIVGGPSGTLPYDFTDSILKVTENPLALGGDGFAVPTQAGNIRAMQYAANLDSALGEGTLFVFTRKQVYALNVPISRTDWAGADDNNQPLQRIVQRTNGGVSDRSIVSVNGDLFYQALDPSIRSLFTALRYFTQWGNTGISANVDRAIRLNDRSLMIYSSAVEFDNYLLNTVLPEQSPQGVIHKGILPLDFDPIATLGEKIPPAWAGLWEGLDILQLLTGDFGGRERCFAVTVSRINQSIQLWELTNDQRFENGDNRVSWYYESPAWTWGREFDLKKLDGGEIWLDRIFGTVDGTVYYRVDGNPCWQFWHAFQICVSRNSCEDVDNPICYPIDEHREDAKFPVTLPTPPSPPECEPLNHRPMTIGHQFQVKIELKGWCRIRGLIVYATPVIKQPFQDLESPPGPFTNLQKVIIPMSQPNPPAPSTSGLTDYADQPVVDYSGEQVTDYGGGLAPF